MADLPSPCSNTAGSPTLRLSDGDPLERRIQTPVPTLASFSRAQRITSLLAAVLSLSLSLVDCLF